MRENFETADALNPECIPEIMLCLGFFLIYFIEELVHCLCDAGGDHLHDDNEMEQQHVHNEVCHKRKMSMVAKR